MLTEGAEIRTQPPRTGRQAFEQMPEGTLCQLINDALIMSPAPTPNHQKLLKKIASVIDRHVAQHALGELLFSPVDVYLDNTNVFQPDIVFVPAERQAIIDWNKGIMGAPDLVIEILSKGNKPADLITKKQVYERTGVQEYWVVDPVSKWCEGFVLVNGLYQSVGEATGQLMVQMFDLAVVF